MGQKAAEYYGEIAKGVTALEKSMGLVEAQVPVMAPDALDFEPHDWSGTLWRMQNAVNKLHVAGSVHMIERVSRDQMIAILRAFDEGDSAGKTVISVVHTVRAFDTLRRLEREYGLPWQQILDFNGMTSNAFYSLLPGDEITIPVPRPISKGLAEVMVFGNQDGENILGRDVGNSIEANATGDLKVLSPLDTFTQGMSNIALSEFGDVPYYESFGIDLKPGEDYPADTLESVVQLRIFNGFSQDPRVKEITVLEIAKKGNSFSVKIEIRPINGESVKLPVQV